tara:strand:- start:1 stop:123 length:123 start_codon:yes stop_codon:yes gene_type:complete
MNKNMLNLETINYISDLNPLASIEKEFSKTHAPVFGLRMP